MRSPFSFTRYVGSVPAGGKALGTSTDANPPPAVPANQDNTYSFDGSDAFGAVVQKHQFYVVGPTYASLGIQLYFFDAASNVWLPVSGGIVAITAAPANPAPVGITPPNPPRVASAQAQAAVQPANARASTTQNNIGVPVIYVALSDVGGTAPSGKYTLYAYPSRTSE